MADWKDILNNEDNPLSEEDLLQYINAKTSVADKKQIEEIATDDFENDALEGLKSLTDPGETPKHVAVLKQQLQKHLRSKKQKKQRPKNTGMQWILYAVVILLLTCILGYAVIRMFGAGV